MNTLYEQDLDQLSRREFLRWTQRGLLGLFGLFLMERAQGKERLVTAGAAAAAPGESVPEMGRVLDNALAVYDRPSSTGNLVNMYWRDLVFPINGVTIGDKDPPYNRVWYLINDEGYVHSGKVQPVALHTNKPLAGLPATGMLGEISVPYTDALFDPKRPDRFATRLYYNTVHWIMGIAKGEKGEKWYRIPDDKLRYNGRVQLEYYARAEHVRPVLPADLLPISPQVPAKDKRLEIRLNEQVVTAYEADKPVFMSRVASGGRFIDGDYTTPSGAYMTNRKRPSRHMASEDLAAPSSYDLPGVPWVCYLTRSGISFHGTYWHNDFGKPRSHGCINLSPQAALWVYRWTNPGVPYKQHTWDQDEGTRVDVIA